MKVRFILTKEENERLIQEKIQEQFPNSKIELDPRPSYSSDAYTIEVEFSIFKDLKIEEKVEELENESK
jgi:hypothetical protein